MYIKILWTAHTHTHDICPDQQNEGNTGGDFPMMVAPVVNYKINKIIYSTFIQRYDMSHYYPSLVSVNHFTGLVYM